MCWSCFLVLKQVRCMKAHANLLHAFARRGSLTAQKSLKQNN
jgi:hypothetical protein